MILFCVGGECRVEAPEIEFECGGRCEIRTHERLAPLPVFKTGALNRSANLPACDRQVQIGKGKCLSALEIVSPDPHMKTAIAPRVKHRYTAFARLNLAGGSYSKRPP